MQSRGLREEYGVTHTCAGIGQMTTPEEDASPRKLHFAPLHYFGEAVKILSGTTRQCGSLDRSLNQYQAPTAAATQNETERRSAPSHE